jgi:hypothetical protein
VGFPRSGTTLTEQVLAAHPAVRTLDEQPFLERAALELAAAGFEYPEDLERAPPSLIETLRRGYLERIGDAGARRWTVDKMPLNLVYLPLARRLFPAARVVVALRDPRDVAVSCYAQVFRPNPAMVHFLTLEGTADLYVAVMGLWQTLRVGLDLPWLETRYEDLVGDFRSAAGRLLDFLDEPWDEAVTRFDQVARETPRSTPSYAEVTRPVHGGAVARWRAHARHLAPIEARLSPFVEAFGYDP